MGFEVCKPRNWARPPKSRVWRLGFRAYDRPYAEWLGAFKQDSGRLIMYNSVCRGKGQNKLALLTIAGEKEKRPETDGNVRIS